VVSLGQEATTHQGAESSAEANQNAVNANVPVNIAGGNITGGNNAANQTLNNEAESSANNKGTTTQSNSQSQS